MATLFIPSAHSTAHANPSMPTIRKGSTGEAVMTLHNELISKGYHPRTSDGSRKRWSDYETFGDETYTQVILFQMDKGLTQDGIVGKNTWKALGHTGTSSSTSSSAALTTYTASPTAQSYATTAIYQKPWFIPAVVGGSLFFLSLVIIIVKD